MKIKKIIFFLKRLLTDLKENKEIELNFDYPNDLSYYYIKFKEELVNSRGGNKAFQFDDHGVPLVLILTYKIGPAITTTRSPSDNMLWLFSIRI